MTTYLLSVHHDDGPPPEDLDLDAVFAAVDQFNGQLQEEGHWVFAGGLLPSTEARTFRLADDGTSTMVTDGPYLETKEHIGGFWIIDADESTIDDIASRAAVACHQDVEVRPFQPEDG